MSDAIEDRTKQPTAEEIDQVGTAQSIASPNANTLGQQRAQEREDRLRDAALGYAERSTVALGLVKHDEVVAAADAYLAFLKGA